MPPARSSKDSKTKESRVLCNRYEIVRKLGSGNFGTAFLCKDLRCRNELKVLKEISVGDLQPDETFDAMHEAKLLSKLDFPNIVKFHDNFLDGEYFCIITEYCEGGDLDQKVKEYKKSKKYFSETCVLDWLVQLVIAVHYMHNRRVLHRDLKARNIFLKNNMVKIGDFGISRILMGTADFASTFTGTPYYMSPEVLKHEGYNSKSDIWSIGCILYELCALDHAFDGQSLMGVMYKIVEGNPPDLPARYSKELSSVFKKMLNKDPDKRPSALEISKMPFIARHMTSMKERLSDEYQTQNTGPENVEQEADDIAKLLRENTRLIDLRDTEEEKKMKNLLPRERMRIRKMQEADQKADEMKKFAKQNMVANHKRKTAIRSSMNQTVKPVWVGGTGEGVMVKEALTVKGIDFKLQQSAHHSYHTLAVDRHEDDGFDSSTYNVTESTLQSVNRADERPITPMTNSMAYETMKDGIPGDREMKHYSHKIQRDLEETHYSQLDEDFDSDDDLADTLVADNDMLPEETVREQEEFLNCLEALQDDTEKTGTLTDVTGAFGPVAREIKIRNLRNECEKVLGKKAFNSAYSHLKKARYNSEGKTLNESAIMDGLRKYVPNPSDCFLVDQLLFLEEQAKLSAIPD